MILVETIIFAIIHCFDSLCSLKSLKIPVWLASLRFEMIFSFHMKSFLCTLSLSIMQYDFLSLLIIYIICKMSDDVHSGIYCQSPRHCFVKGKLPGIPILKIMQDHEFFYSRKRIIFSRFNTFHWDYFEWSLHYSHRNIAFFISWGKSHSFPASLLFGYISMWR